MVVSNELEATVSRYLGYDIAVMTDFHEKLEVIEAELAAQAKACRVDTMTPDLIQALCRRVARAIAARNMPLGFQTSISDVGVTAIRLGGLDAEIRRLEAPYRRVVVG